METIGLIAALPQESKALLRCLKGYERVAFGKYKCIRFQLIQRTCLLVTSGMGLMRAIDATRTLMKMARLDLVVSFGIAGAVKDDLQIGDVVIARESFILKKGHLSQVRSLATLTEAAWKSAAQYLQTVEARLFFGTSITTRGAQIVTFSQDQKAHPILEMETAGIARIAAERNIPLLSIRSISDNPQAPIPIDLQSILDEKDDLRIVKMLLIILRHPLIIFKSLEMIRNTRKAANHAARALLAVLNQPASIVSQ